MQANANSAILSSTQASGNQRKKSLSFLIKINVSSSRDSYRTTVSSQVSIFTREKLIPLPVKTNAASPGQVSQEWATDSYPKSVPPLGAPVLYKHTQKHTKNSILTPKGENKVVLCSPEEWEHISCRLTHLVHPLGCSHHTWQVGIWVMRCWDPPSSPSHAGKSH